MGSVKLSTPREDEPWRLVRLARVLASLNGGGRREDLLVQIEELGDEKGRLVVTTRRPLVLVEKNMLRAAWERENEYAGIVWLLSATPTSRLASVADIRTAASWGRPRGGVH